MSDAQNKQRIRILIADDHAIVREGLRALIETEPQMELVAEAADGVEAVQQAGELRPDVILLDLMMPRKNGIAAINEIKQETRKPVSWCLPVSPRTSWSFRPSSPARSATCSRTRPRKSCSRQSAASIAANPHCIPPSRAN